jgi:hypothetical protein
MSDYRKEFWNSVDKTTKSKHKTKIANFSDMEEANKHILTKKIVETNQKNTAIITEETPDNKNMVEWMKQNAKLLISGYNCPRYGKLEEAGFTR